MMDGQDCFGRIMPSALHLLLRFSLRQSINFTSLTSSDKGGQNGRWFRNP
jgi:hypothetical protein